jgi:hypothetical protein
MSTDMSIRYICVLNSLALYWYKSTILKHGATELVRFLLESKADVKGNEHAKKIPLLAAVEKGRAGMFAICTYVHVAASVFVLLY